MHVCELGGQLPAGSRACEPLSSAHSGRCCSAAPKPKHPARRGSRALTPGPGHDPLRTGRGRCGPRAVPRLPAGSPQAAHRHGPRRLPARPKPTPALPHGSPDPPDPLPAPHSPPLAPSRTGTDRAVGRVRSAPVPGAAGRSSGLRVLPSRGQRPPSGREGQGRAGQGRVAQPVVVAEPPRGAEPGVPLRAGTGGTHSSNPVLPKVLKLQSYTWSPANPR